MSENGVLGREISRYKSVEMKEVFIYSIDRFLLCLVLY